MDVSKMKGLFSEFSESDYLNFDKVEFKISKKKDVHAFVLLDRIFPDDAFSMIENTEYDQINLYLDLEKLSKVIMPEQILELVRCGVSCYESDDFLSMNV
jgi:hypothetical protein